jgi:TRAP-type C4-dicarboxylate transport system permease small subunit
MMFSKTINSLTRYAKWLAVITMGLMMLFIAIAVLARMVFTPIVGDVEIVRLGMVIMIMLGLSYTQNIDGHISIGLIVDKLPQKIQYALDIFGSLLNFLITMMIGFIFIGVGMEHKTTMPLSTDLLSIPYYPFDFIIVIGFFLWGLEALLKVITSITNFIQAGKTRKGDPSIWQ